MALNMFRLMVVAICLVAVHCQRSSVIEPPIQPPKQLQTPPPSNPAITAIPALATRATQVPTRAATLAPTKAATQPPTKITTQAAATSSMLPMLEPTVATMNTTIVTINTVNVTMENSTLAIIVATPPPSIPNSCNVTVWKNMACSTFDQQRCGPGTRFDIDMCVCNHANRVDVFTCKTIVIPEFIPNNCNVKVRYGINCSRFSILKCPPSTRYDIRWCVCNHAGLVNPLTCSS